MELNNEFRVAVPAATTWQVLTDVERVAPCIPGAQLLSVDGDDFTGAVKVKVGPITVSYKGEASFQEKDQAAQRVVIKASGKETRGSGNAAALVTAQVKDEGPAGSLVSITTDLTISGKAAQFGRGVLADVSTNLIGQFARNLETELLGGSAPAGTSSSAAAAPSIAAAADAGGDSVDLLKVVAVPMAKRYSPALAAVAAGVAVGFLLGRRKRAHPAADLADELQAALAPAAVMKAAAFTYHRPGTVTEAAQMLGEFGEDAKILAGGQSLVPMLAMRLTYFENLIDISRIDELKNIELSDGALSVAAGTPHSLVGMDDEVADSVPLLTLSTPYIGHFQIRTRGTLGGAIAHADPAAEYAAVALALDATIEATSSRGRRDISAADFFTGLWETSLAPDEILTAVRFPVWGGRCGFAVEEFARRHGDFAIAGATVAVELDDENRVARCGIGLLGLGSTPLRGSAAEDDRRRPARRCRHRRRGRQVGDGWAVGDSGRSLGIGRVPVPCRRCDGGPCLGRGAAPGTDIRKGGDSCMSCRSS